MIRMLTESVWLNNGPLTFQVIIEKINSNITSIHLLKIVNFHFIFFMLMFDRVDYSFNVIGITETMDMANLYSVSNFKHIYSCRKDQIGGGVSIYINNIFITDLSHDHIVFSERKCCCLMGDFNIDIINPRYFICSFFSSFD